MKSKQSSFKKVSWPYENFTNHYSNPTNRVSRDIVSNSSMAMNSPQVNNILSISNSRAMQKPAILLTLTELPAPSQHSPNIQTAGDNISIIHDQGINITCCGNHLSQ